MLRAAIAMIRGGQERFRAVADPFGDGPFQHRPRRRWVRPAIRLAVSKSNRRSSSWSGGALLRRACGKSSGPRRTTGFRSRPDRPRLIPCGSSASGIQGGAEDAMSLVDRLGRSLFVALAVGLGWGIRGDFGHIIGAMYPGAALGLALAYVSGQRSLFLWMPILAAPGGVRDRLGGDDELWHPPRLCAVGHAPQLRLRLPHALLAGLGLGDLRRRPDRADARAQADADRRVARPAGDGLLQRLGRVVPGRGRARLPDQSAEEQRLDRLLRRGASGN